MTISEARKLLGTSFDNMTDLEIEEIISSFQKISVQIIDSYFTPTKHWVKSKTKKEIK